MIALIKNEYIKLLHKKSLWITLIVILGFISLVNYIYTKDFTPVTPVLYKENTYTDRIEEYEGYIANLNKDSNDYYTNLAYYQSVIDTYKVLEQYNDESWKEQLVFDEYQNLSNQYYSLCYLNKNSNELKKISSKIENLINILKQNDWRNYVEIKISEVKEDLEINQESLKVTTNEALKINTENTIEILQYRLYLLEYRLDNNVSYDNSYLDKAISSLENDKPLQIQYKNQENLSSSELTNYDDINSNILKNEFVLEHKIDANNDNSLKGILTDFFNEYSFLIVVFIVLIGGAIVSEEFHKGTIKTLLVVPYSRAEIILAKIITVISMIFIVSFIILLYQFLLGGILLGFDSIKYPVLVYNSASKTLITMNVFQYVGIVFFTFLPYYTIFALISICLSTLINNTGFSIAISLFINIGSGIVNSIATAYNLKFMKYFISLNWNFMEYLFSSKPAFKYASLQSSIIVYLVYFIVILITTIFIFKKRNIKNV